MAPTADSMTRRGARLIMRSLRAHPWPHALAMLGAAGFVVAVVGGTWVLRAVTDEVVVPALEDGEIEGSEVWAAMAAIVVVSLARGLGTIGRRWFLILAELRTQRDWRSSLLGQYLDLPLRFHRDRPSGELLAHADTDVVASTMVLKPLAFTASVLLLVVVAMISLLVVHPLLALVALVLFPTLALMSRVYTRRVETPSADVQHQVGVVSSVAHESFDGALVIKSLGREAAEVERMRAASDRLREHRIRVGRLRGTFEPVIDALPNIGTIVLLLIGSWLVSRGSATPGDLVLAATLFLLMGTPLRVVGFFLEELPRSVVSLDRVDRVLELEVEPSGGVEDLVDEPLAVDVDDLEVVIDGHRILDGVSLHVDPGETVALVGATGSGKTTILESIAGLIDIEAGTVRIGGRALGEIDEGELRSALAMVFQEAFLFADSIDENVSLGASTDVGAVTAALSVAHADGFVGDMDQGAETVVGERGVTLSGGQRQRVALARALARTPRLLLLDDATSALDPVVEAEILDNLRYGLATTLILVAHRISTIKLADRVIFVADGQVMAQGSHRELLERDDYRALVTAYERADAA